MIKSWEQTFVPAGATVREAMAIIDKGALQIGLVVDPDSVLLGTITDGDIRRGILRGLSLDGPVTEIMRRNPLTVTPEQGWEVALKLMRIRNIKQIPVVDDQGHVLGLEVLDEIVRASHRENWVVLMVGGLGTRLRPLTDSLPKPLLPVGGRPLLETIIENFVSQGFGKFFLSVNYKSEMVEHQIGDGRRWGVEIGYLREDKRLGTAGALGLLPERPAHPFVVMNGDLLTTVNFGQMLAFHRQHNALATMGVREYSVQIPYGVVNMAAQQVTRIVEKPVQRHFVNAGIYTLDPEVLDYVRPGENLDMPDLLQSVIEVGHPVSAFPIREYWIDIGSPEDFQRASAEYEGVFT